MEYKVFGCKVNKYYTDRWLSSSYLKNKEGIFISTCVVTDRAKKKWLKFVRDSIKNLEGDSKIYMSGCGNILKGEIQNDFYEIYPELEQFKDKIELLGENPNYPIEKLKEKIYTKKFLVIQGGCDSHCSFCLTVIKRGNHTYRKKEDIISDILDFEREGGKEVVITGINLGAWGEKTTNHIGGSKFVELLENILEKTSIPRIRISSLGPEFINEKTIEIFKNKRIYPHFHISVQSGSGKILKSMNRHYDDKYIKKLLEELKNIKRLDGVEVSVGADLIVGFPGENEEDFEKTLDLVKNGFITKVHVFPFSSHKIGEKVPAGNFPNQIEDKIKKERVKIIEEIGDNIRDKFIERNKGKKFEVLIEYTKTDGNEKKWKGWTENYIEVNESNFIIDSGEIKRNNIIYGHLK